MEMKKIFSITLVALLAAGLGYFWYSKSLTLKSQIQYITATAEKGTITTSVDGSGNIIVDKNATVDPTISGTVTDLAVKVGDQVKKGQLLFKIENDQLGVSVAKSLSSYKQAENSLESAKVQKKQAQADLDAAKEANKNNADSSSTDTGTGKNSGQQNNTITYTDQQIKVLEDKIDLANSSINVAEKNLSAAYKDYKYQQSVAGKRTVTAPISGIVNQINIKNGSDLGKMSSSSGGGSIGTSSSSGSSSQSPIIIGDLKTLKAQVQINEVDISKVKRGQKAMLKLDAFEGSTYSGQLEKIDSLGNLNQGVVTYNVTIKFDSLDRHIKPEMSVSASIITEVKQNVITISNSALKSAGNSSYYVEILNGETPEQHPVEIGIANNTETEITNGINIGDKVITQTIDPNATTSQSSGQGGGGGFRMPGMGGGGGFRGGGGRSD